MCPVRCPPGSGPRLAQDVFCTCLWKTDRADGGFSHALCQPSSLSPVTVPDCCVMPSSRLPSSWRSCWLGWCSPHPTRTAHGIIPGTNFHSFNSSQQPYTTPVQHWLCLNLSLINKLMSRAPLCGAMVLQNGNIKI